MPSNSLSLKNQIKLKKYRSRAVMVHHVSCFLVVCCLELVAQRLRDDNDRLAADRADADMHTPYQIRVPTLTDVGLISWD
jgi:hypothetical protein